MNKADLINAIAEKAGLSKVDYKKLLKLLQQVSLRLLQLVIKLAW